ncbi:MAG: ATP-grasp domain-containing protein, partial [Candidatus Puniceispirillum sp.]
SPNSDLDAAFDALGSDDVILEEMIPFTAEASFLIARAHDGSSCVFPASLNRHKDGILDQSVAPASLDDTVIAAGTEAVTKLADALDLFGVMALECFITNDNRLLFNEIAPRPHNSFHWTIEGCATSQFTQLARVLAGMPFGSVHSYGQWQMDNLLGEHMENVPALLASDQVHVHLYGKSGAKKGRKMGHTNRQIAT